MTGALARLFGDGFRVFFLNAALFAVLAVLAWELWLGVHAAGGMIYALPFGMAPHLWHAHEMIFGYGTAAMGGFLMTATPGWTGARHRPQLFIGLAIGLWLAGRFAIWFSGSLPMGLVAVIDLAFLPLMAVRLVLQVVRRPKPQVLVFLLFVTLVWISNLLVHLQWTGRSTDTLMTGLHAGLFSFCAMISILAGRVVPGFTRNALKRAGVPEANWPLSPAGLTRAANGLGLLLVFGLLAGLPSALTGALALAAALAQLIRLALWRGYLIWRQPILWSLHLAVLMLTIGLALFGLAGLGIGSQVAALHVLGIGAVGGMTLAIMSRAILSHTGQPILAPGAVAIGYGLIALAAVLRWVASEFPADLYFPAMLSAGAIWILAFVLFLAALGPVLFLPRLKRPSE